MSQSSCDVPHRTLMHWTRQLDERGPASFLAPHPGRGGAVMTSGTAAECGRLLDAGATIAEVARLVRVGESTLRKAVRSGRVVRTPATGVSAAPDVGEGATKSERGRVDARAAEGMGTACTRADECMAAALGVLKSAVTRFERCRDVDLGGLLAGLPALCGSGLLSGLGRHLSLPRGFYRALHILITLGFMALARIRQPEGLRHVPPGELGKVVGLDRVPEVRTLREKIAVMADLRHTRSARRAPDAASPASRFPEFQVGAQSYVVVFDVVRSVVRNCQHTDGTSVGR